MSLDNIKIFRYDWIDNNTFNWINLNTFHLKEGKKIIPYSLIKWRCIQDCTYLFKYQQTVLFSVLSHVWYGLIKAVV